MTQIGFYHLTRFTLEQALPKLLEKAYGSNLRTHVMAGSAERVEYLNNFLWAYRDDSFLPHGSAADGEGGLQPIFLGTDEIAPNDATVLVVCDGANPQDVGQFSRVLDVFDGNDPNAVAKARERWRDWKNAGHQLVYYQQTEQGGWVEKART